MTTTLKNSKVVASSLRPRMKFHIPESRCYLGGLQCKTILPNVDQTFDVKRNKQVRIFTDLSFMSCLKDDCYFQTEEGHLFKSCFTCGSNFSTLLWCTKLCLGRVAIEAYSLETRNLGLVEGAGLDDVTTRESRVADLGRWTCPCRTRIEASPELKAKFQIILKMRNAPEARNFCF